MSKTNFSPIAFVIVICAITGTGLFLALSKDTDSTSQRVEDDNKAEGSTSSVIACEDLEWNGYPSEVAAREFQSFEELVNLSTDIAVANTLNCGILTTENETTEGLHQLAYTFDIVNRLKGDLPLGEVSVNVVSAYVDGEWQSLRQIPELETGQEVVLFLTKYENEYYAVMRGETISLKSQEDGHFYLNAGPIANQAFDARSILDISQTE